METKNIISNSKSGVTSVNTITNEGKDISIKFSEEAFAKMLIELLGKKQTLKWVEENAFRLNINDLCQFHYLLVAKIDKEQFTTLNLFSATIHYNDNTFRTFNSVENLESYLETRDVYSVAVSLKWDIVLKFPTSENIEKQIIEISFRKKDKLPNGEINVNIEHTNQAWAIEVLNLFKSNISQLVHKQSKVVDYIAPLSISHSKSGSFVMYIYFMLVILSLLFNTKYGLTDEQQAVNAQLYKDILSVSEKYSAKEQSKLNIETGIVLNIVNNNRHSEVEKVVGLSQPMHDILNNYISKYNKAETNKSFRNTWKYPSFILAIIIIIQYYSYRAIKYFQEDSFILITKKSFQMYEKFKLEHNPIKFNSISAVAFTIIIGLIVNIISGSEWFSSLLKLLK